MTIKHHKKYKLILSQRGFQEVRVLFPVVLDYLQEVLPLLLLLITVSPNLVLINVHHTEGSLSTVIYNCHVGHNTFILGVLGSVIVPHRE